MKVRPGHASGFGRLSVADYIGSKIETSEKTQAEIAREAGFNAPNMLTMIKQGRTKLPFERVAALADALAVSRAYLMRLALGEYQPATLKVMEECFGHMVSQNEFSIIKFVREVSGYSDPGLGSERARELLEEAFGWLKGPTR